MRMRHRGCVYASCTAANRFGAKYAPLHRVAMLRRSSGSVEPEPGMGIASPSVTYTSTSALTPTHMLPQTCRLRDAPH